MKSIQSPIVFLNWLEDGLHRCCYQSWKPKHSWCQSKFDKWVGGAPYSLFVITTVTSPAPIWIEAICFPVAFLAVLGSCSICSHSLNLQMNYIQPARKLFHISKHFISCLLTAPYIGKMSLIPSHHSWKTPRRKKIIQKTVLENVLLHSPMYQTQWVQREAFAWQRAVIRRPVGAIVWNPTCWYRQRESLIPESFL